MSNDDFTRRTSPNPVSGGGGPNGPAIAGIIVAIVIVVGLLVWAPWRNNANTSAGNAPTSTVGSSSSAPTGGASTPKH